MLALLGSGGGEGRKMSKVLLGILGMCAKSQALAFLLWRDVGLAAKK